MDGFELSFTHPVDKKSATALASYTLGTYCYICKASYAIPKVGATPPKITAATVSEDGLRVTL